MAANHSVEAIREYLNADSLHYLSVDGMVKATGLPKESFCLACWDGNYPVPYDPTTDKEIIERRRSRGKACGILWRRMGHRSGCCKSQTGELAPARRNPIIVRAAWQRHLKLGVRPTGRAARHPPLRIAAIPFLHARFSTSSDLSCNSSGLFCASCAALLISGSPRLRLAPPRYAHRPPCASRRAFSATALASSSMRSFSFLRLKLRFRHHLQLLRDERVIN